MKNTYSKLLHGSPQLTYAFTTRHSGFSKVPFNSNNLAFHVGDEKDDVLNNHKKLAQGMGYNNHNLVHMQQVHSDKIVIVDPKIHNFDNPPECDALMTNLPNIPLMVMVADCTPVLFYDPKQRVIAVAHAGRAGALQGIVPKTITKMQREYNSDLDDIMIVLGPSIGVCCYEVNRKIVEKVTKEGYGLATVYTKGQYYLDVNAIIKEQLRNLNISDERVEDLGICNACENKTFFSYRADRQKTGRFSGIIMLEA